MIRNILDYGANPSCSNNAPFIQQAINACGKDDVLLIPEGQVFKTGVICLHGEMGLEVEGTLMACDDMNAFHINDAKEKDHLDCPTYVNCDYNGKPVLYFIYAKGAKNLRIFGHGTIDGNETLFYGPINNGDFIDGIFYPRMPMLFLENIQNLIIEDVLLTRSAFWTVHMVGCQDVWIHHLTIRNNMALANCDGIDPDHCHRVKIEDCDIRCADDAIVFKTTEANQVYGDCEFIEVKNCHLQSTSGAIKFGSETCGDIHDVYAHDIQIENSNRGITFQLRDYGDIYRCRFENISMDTHVAPKPYFWGHGEPIALTAVQRVHDKPVGDIHDVVFSHITADSELGYLLYGEAKKNIHNIRFENVSLTLRNKTKWKKKERDLRPHEGTTFFPTEGNALYSRNAERCEFVNCSMNIEESAKEYLGALIDSDTPMAL